MTSCIVYPDLLFSYWIFLWYILFICDFVPYSPKYFLIIAAIFNSMQIIGYIKNGSSSKNIICFIFVILIMKIIPLLTIINKDSNNLSDIFFSICLFMIYILWILLNYYCLDRINDDMFSILFGSDKTRPCKTFVDIISSKVF